MKTAIITGASSGIGKAIAYELAKEKYDLLLIARREELLSKISEEISKNFKVKVHYLVIDLSHYNNFSFIKEFFLENFDNLNVLVNNVGIGYYGGIESITKEKMEEIFWTNLFSHILITKEFVPIMKSQGFGTIVNIISLIAFFPLKNWSLYTSTKYAQMGFFKSLRRELYKYKIRVINVYPGTTKTEFFKNLNLPYNFPIADSPEKIAKAVIKAIKGRRNDVFVSFRDWLFSRIGMFLR